MSVERIELEFDNNLEEHLAAGRLYYRSTNLVKADRYVAIILVVLGVALTLGWGPHWWSLILFPLALAEWAGWLTLWRLRVRTQYRRNPKFREPYHLTFADEEIHFKTPSIDSKIAWTHCERFLEDARFFLVVYGPWNYSVLPKRALGGKDDVVALRDMLARNIAAG